MRDMHIALAQGHWTGDQASTKALYRELAAEAAKTGAELICLPEFSILPYFPGVRDPAGFAWAEPLAGGPSDAILRRAGAQAQRHASSAACLSATPRGDYWDTATIHDAAGRLRLHAKVHIPSGEGYHETDYFAGADQFPVHDIGAVRLAAPTCYDQWFPELARIYALEGAEFIYYPTAIGSEPTADDFDSAACLAHGDARTCRRQWRLHRRLQPHRAGKRCNLLRQQFHLRSLGERTGAGEPRSRRSHRRGIKRADSPRAISVALPAAASAASATLRPLAEGCAAP